MAALRWTSEAVNWLNDIYNYIAEDNPGAAGKVIEGIYNKTQFLKEYPEIGHLYRIEKDGEIRIVIYGHYRIAYLLSDNDSIYQE